MSPKGKRLEDGSSPRVRGTDTPQRHRLYAPRFIPASAGNSMGSAVLRLRNAVHPRECGEQEPTTSHGPGVHGSSPRVRGTDGTLLVLRLGRRFIPASAGNRWNVAGIATWTAVHPRECGEQKFNRLLKTLAYGSSPRVRGTGERPRGTNPTHAVHPRECGEQSFSSCFSRRPTGSSPRVRGTVRRYVQLKPEDRFIPASAGNSTVKCSFDSVTPVHPRECGEQRYTETMAEKVGGSSPRVRGTAR